MRRVKYTLQAHEISDGHAEVIVSEGRREGGKEGGKEGGREGGEEENMPPEIPCPQGAKQEEEEEMGRDGGTEGGRDGGTEGRRDGGTEGGPAYPCTEIVTPSMPFTLARMPRMSVLNSLGVVYPTVSGTFRVVAP